MVNTNQLKNKLWFWLRDMGYDDLNRYNFLWEQIKPKLKNIQNINYYKFGQCGCDDIYIILMYENNKLIDGIIFDFDFIVRGCFDDVYNNECEPDYDDINCLECFYNINGKMYNDIKRGVII